MRWILLCGSYFLLSWKKAFSCLLSRVPGWGFPEQGILGQDNVTTCQSLLTHMLGVQR